MQDSADEGDQPEHLELGNQLRQAKHAFIDEVSALSLAPKDNLPRYLKGPRSNTGEGT